MNCSIACVGTQGRRIAFAFVACAIASACSPPAPRPDAGDLLDNDVPTDRATPDVPGAMDVTMDAGPTLDVVAPLDAPGDAPVDAVVNDAVGAAAPWVYVGTGDGNLSLYAFDRASGRMTLMTRLAVGMFPSYGVFDAAGRHLYTTLEGTSRLASFAIDATSGALSPLGVVAATGMTPTFIALDHSGHFALVADYTGGDVAVFPVGSTGALGAAPRGYPTGMLAHSVLTDPSNHFALACNKGSDVISQFRFDATSGALTPNTPSTFATAAGAGPRHVAFHPTAGFVYVVDETDCNVNAYRFNSAAGTLTLLQTLSTLAVGTPTMGNTGAEVMFGPDGRFLYVSTRGTNTLSVYSVDATSGHMAFVSRVASGGTTPRDFTVDGPGNRLLVANQDSNNVVTFVIDPSTGRLTQTATTVVGTGAYWVGVLER